MLNFRKSFLLGLIMSSNLSSVSVSSEMIWSTLKPYCKQGLPALILPTITSDPLIDLVTTLTGADVDERVIQLKSAKNLLVTMFNQLVVEIPLYSRINKRVIFDFTKKLLEMDSQFYSERSKFLLNFKLHKAADAIGNIAVQLPSIIGVEAISTISSTIDQLMRINGTLRSDLDVKTKGILCVASIANILTEPLRWYMVCAFIKGLLNDEKMSKEFLEKAYNSAKDPMSVTARIINSSDLVKHSNAGPKELEELSILLKNANISLQNEDAQPDFPLAIKICIIKELLPLIFGVISDVLCAKNVDSFSLPKYLMLRGSRLLSSFQQSLFQSIAFKKINCLKVCLEDLLEPSKTSDLPSASDLDVKKAEIEFKDVHFEFQRDNKVSFVFDLNGELKIPAGSMVAFVGETGSGKSVLLKQLLQDFERNPDQITLDGQDIAKGTLSSLYDNISYVSQSPSILPLSIRDNITYGIDGVVTDEELFEVCKAACIHDFIMGLPEGYKTILGDMGMTISGGQAQRIGIARAILRLRRGARILILDEATSALDSQTEGSVHKNILAITESFRKKGELKTVITVAHRYSSIAGVDKIFVFSEGTVVEEGTFAELLKEKNGYFYALFKAQLEDILKQIPKGVSL